MGPTGFQQHPAAFKLHVDRSGEAPATPSNAASRSTPLTLSARLPCTTPAASRRCAAMQMSLGLLCHLHAVARQEITA